MTYRSAFQRPAFLVSLLLLVFPTFSFAKNEMPSLPGIPYDYAITNLPAHLIDAKIPNQIDDMKKAAMINHQATLGRVLFYDKNLSVNKLVSCSSCHKQAKGFDDDKRFSIGFAGIITPRNSMGLTNARFNFSGKLFWDQRASSMRSQALVAFFDPVEMGLKQGQLVERVKTQDYYKKLFENAYGSPQISQNKIADALTRFVSSIISYNSQYDKGRIQVPDRLQNFPNLNAQQNRGKTLFFTPADAGGGGCSSCHLTENFVSPAQGINNGIDRGDENNADNGIGEITRKSGAIGKFRVPSLRNIAMRAPYMHDGRFATLSAVIEHYSTGIKNHPNLGAALKKDNQPRRLNFSTLDKLALIAFMKTLTDRQLLNDEKFSNPFR